MTGILPFLKSPARFDTGSGMMLLLLTMTMRTMVLMMLVCVLLQLHCPTVWLGSLWLLPSHHSDRCVDRRRISHNLFPVRLHNAMNSIQPWMRLNASACYGIVRVFSTVRHREVPHFYGLDANRNWQKSIVTWVSSRTCDRKSNKSKWLHLHLQNIIRYSCFAAIHVLN